MPDLPTFTVTNEQAQRLLAAFGSVENYKDWLRQQLIDFVIAKESQAEAIALNENRQNRRTELETAIPQSNPTTPA